MEPTKLFFLIYSGTEPERIVAMLDRSGVSGWTELGAARGAGRTGRREGTRAWPGLNALFVTLVAEPEAGGLERMLREAARDLPEGERLHLAVMPVERFA